MAQPWEHHHRVIVESYSARKPGCQSEVRVRPIAGQMFPPDMKVQFSREARKMHAIGTRFQIWVKLSDIHGGTPFLQSPHKWPYVVVD